MGITIWVPLLVGLLVYLIPTLFVGGLVAGVTIGTGPTEQTKRELKSGHRRLILTAISVALLTAALMHIVSALIG